MADTKISALPASTVPLAGTEVLPIVQSSSTKQVSVANLTAGRSVAALSVVTPTIQAEAGSAGGTIKNGSGVAQMQWGSGGGSNLSLEVATNINPANAVVNISPTGTGTVAISPATASTMNNVAIGGTTALAGRFTGVTSTDLTASTAVVADANKKLVSLVQPAFLVQLTAAQTIAGASFVKITLDNEIFDTNSNFDPTTNYRFTPTVAGYYQINAALFYNTSGASGLMQLLVYKNGSTVASTANVLSAAGYVSLSISQVISMNGSSDYLELYTYNGNALSQTTSNATYVYMSGSLVRGA
jgi:hypothetical protein